MVYYRPYEMYGSKGDNYWLRHADAGVSNGKRSGSNRHPHTNTVPDSKPHIVISDQHAVSLSFTVTITQRSDDDFGGKYTDKNTDAKTGKKSHIDPETDAYCNDRSDGYPNHYPYPHTDQGTAFGIGSRYAARIYSFYSRNSASCRKPVCLPENATALNRLILLNGNSTFRHKRRDCADCSQNRSKDCADNADRKGNNYQVLSVFILNRNPPHIPLLYYLLDFLEKLFALYPV